MNGEMLLENLGTTLRTRRLRVGLICSFCFLGFIVFYKSTAAIRFLPDSDSVFISCENVLFTHYIHDFCLQDLDFSEAGESVRICLVSFPSFAILNLQMHFKVLFLHISPS